MNEVEMRVQEKRRTKYRMQCVHI